MFIITAGLLLGATARLAFHGIFARGQIHAMHWLSLTVWMGLGIYYASPMIVGFLLIDVAYYSLAKTKYLPKYAKLLNTLVSPFIRWNFKTKDAT